VHKLTKMCKKRTVRRGTRTRMQVRGLRATGLRDLAAVEKQAASATISGPVCMKNLERVLCVLLHEECGGLAVGH